MRALWALARSPEIEFESIATVYSQNPAMNFDGNTVGNVSGNRCESDCRSKDGEFDPGLAPYFRGY